MQLESQLVRQTAHYKAVRERLFAGMKKKPALAVLRDHDAHMLAWREWCAMKASISAVSTSMTVKATFGTYANGALPLALDESQELVITRRSMKDICLDILKAFPSVNFDDIRGPRRCRYIVAARQECMYAIYNERRDVSFPMIGRFFGGRDHTTVLHAVHKIRAAKEQA